MFIKTERKQLTRTNNRSKLNAMEYLANKQPETYTFKRIRYTESTQKAGWYLIEKHTDKNGKEFLDVLDKIEFVPNF
jgi:hypothetical protein